MVPGVLPMKALVISVQLGHGASSDTDHAAHAEEFTLLARGAGAQILASLPVRRERPDAAFFIGKGKLEEAVALARMRWTSCCSIKPSRLPSSATWNAP